MAHPAMRRPSSTVFAATGGWGRYRSAVISLPIFRWWHGSAHASSGSRASGSPRCAATW